MSKIKVQIRFSQELEEWLPSYPGDPMVRPAIFAFDIRYSDRKPLEEWLEVSTPGYVAQWGKLRHPSGIRSWSGIHTPELPGWTSWYEGQVSFTNKGHAMLFKLTWS